MKDYFSHLGLIDWRARSEPQYIRFMLASCISLILLNIGNRAAGILGFWVTYSLLDAVETS